MNRDTILRLAAALLAAATLTSCSLLKVAVSTGDPLPREDVKLRMLTRGFYHDLSAQVARSADSIAVAASDDRVRMAAIRWKIRATRAGVEAAMQGIPEISLADLWILCLRMDRAFDAAPDSLLFGAQSGIARATAAQLVDGVATLAREELPTTRFSQMSRFVEQYVERYPAGSQGAQTANTTYAWMQFLRAQGVEEVYPIGSISEVLADINDRVSGQTQQISSSVGWSKELIEMQFRQDSLKSKLTAQLDSLERNFDRMATVAEHLPEISQQVLADLGRQASQLIWAVDRTMSRAFEDLDRQRGELQGYVSLEREALVAQLRDAANDLVRTTLDAAPGVIGRAVIYLVVALLLLLGVPFALGFWLGGVRQKRGTPKDVEGK